MFRPQKRGQYEPVTATSSLDCVCAVTGQLIACATVDAKWPNHAEVRAASGIVGRGISYLEAENAAAKYGVSLAARYGLSRTQALDAIAVAPFALSIDAAVTLHTTRRTNNFAGNHTVFVVASNLWPAGERCACELLTTTRHWELTIDDPGTTVAGYMQWSADLAFRAAEARTGGNGINVLAGRDTEGVSWTGVGVHAIRSDPSYSTGSAIGQTVNGHVYPGGRTENGGGWNRPDGSTAHGWVHIKTATHWGWARGSALR